LASMMQLSAVLYYFGPWILFPLKKAVGSYDAAIRSTLLLWALDSLAANKQLAPMMQLSAVLYSFGPWNLLLLKSSWIL
jgi:hypothetical protein